MQTKETGWLKLTPLRSLSYHSSNLSNIFANELMHMEGTRRYKTKLNAKLNGTQNY